MRYAIERLEDFIAGIVTAAIGGFIVIEASGYGAGSLNDMGPGFFPVMIGSFMMILALVMVVTARPSAAPQPVDKNQMRGILCLTAAFIAFAFTVEAFGMLLSVFLAVFLSALGNRKTPVLYAALLAVGTAVIATLIFRVGLGLQIKAF